MTQREWIYIKEKIIFCTKSKFTGVKSGTSFNSILLMRLESSLIIFTITLFKLNEVKGYFHSL